jgi:hypothetical protein
VSQNAANRQSGGAARSEARIRVAGRAQRGRFNELAEVGGFDPGLLPVGAAYPGPTVRRVRTQLSSSPAACQVANSTGTGGRT